MNARRPPLAHAATVARRLMLATLADGKAPLAMIVTLAAAVAAAVALELPPPSSAATTPTSLLPAGANLARTLSGFPHRERRVVNGVPLSFIVQTLWEKHGISINQSTRGSQGAEAIIFFATFPGPEHAHACANLVLPPVNPSTADLAARVATAPGTKLLKGPSDVTVGGHAAKRVVITVRKKAGCDPGFFYKWHARPVGALWTTTSVGDTINVWIVKVHGKRLFIEAETTKGASAAVEQEIQQIVKSISFD
jgi:hypothetical protein